MESEADDFPGEPIGYAAWPAEIRELHGRIVRTAGADDGVASLKVDLEHLEGLAQQTQDVVVQRAARLAMVHVLCKFLPEEMARLMFRDRGRAAIEAATTVLLDRDATDWAREKAERLLALMAEKFPFRGRA